MASESQCEGGTIGSGYLQTTHSDQSRDWGLDHRLAGTGASSKLTEKEGGRSHGGPCSQ
jgi:hypothetical protein